MLKIAISISLQPNGTPKVLGVFMDPSNNVNEVRQIMSWEHLADLSLDSKGECAEVSWSPGAEDWCLINWGPRPAN